ncbi:hypothetical protein [Phenylobacterium sp.]|jgi:hypothetical protein|uniref:hypothetical protein n=1 Tax=Phenylobacterium sp. TaxID=1871053 RepID=UPI002F42051C
MSGKALISSKRIQKLRDLIATAEREGAGPGDMLLRLTLGDASELRRDRSVALHEIRFAEGEMHFLGVKVLEGGVTASRLDLASA